MLAMKDGADQKCATPLIGQGPAGRVAIFNNGFLSPDEYEEGVTLTHGSWSIPIPGRIYGGQTKYVKIPNNAI
jgi:starvation-inducible outer membrane lipoprotein